MEPFCEFVKEDIKEEPGDNHLTTSLQQPSGLDRVRDADMMMNSSEDPLKIEIKDEPFDDHQYTSVPLSSSQQASGVSHVRLSPGLIESSGSSQSSTTTTALQVAHPSTGIVAALNNNNKNKISSQRHWSHDAIISLMEKVQEHEVLWNIKHPLFHKKILKRKLFEEIRNQLSQSHPGMASLTTDDMLAKFTYLRGNFQRVLRKIRNTPSGSSGKSEPKWEYFKACSFLLDVYDNHSFESSLELPQQEEVVYESTLEDLVQADFSPLYSPRSIGVSPAPSAASTSSSIDAPYILASQSPSPQPITCTPEPQDVTHTQSPHNAAHTPPPQDVLHNISHPSTASSTSTPAPSVTQRGKKRKLTDSGDVSEKLVNTIEKVCSVMDAFIQSKIEKKSGKYDVVISGMEAFLKSYTISDKLKTEFGSKVLSLLSEYMEKSLETQHD